MPTLVEAIGGRRPAESRAESGFVYYVRHFRSAADGRYGPPVGDGHPARPLRQRLPADPALRQRHLGRQFRRVLAGQAGEGVARRGHLATGAGRCFRTRQPWTGGVPITGCRPSRGSRIVAAVTLPTAPGRHRAGRGRRRLGVHQPVARSRRLLRPACMPGCCGTSCGSHCRRRTRRISCTPSTRRPGSSAAAVRQDGGLHPASARGDRGEHRRRAVCHRRSGLVDGQCPARRGVSRPGRAAGLSRRRRRARDAASRPSPRPGSARR